MWTNSWARRELTAREYNLETSLDSLRAATSLGLDQECLEDRVYIYWYIEKRERFQIPTCFEDLVWRSEESDLGWMIRPWHQGFDVFVSAIQNCALVFNAVHLGTCSEPVFHQYDFHMHPFYTHVLMPCYSTMIGDPTDLIAEVDLRQSFISCVKRKTIELVDSSDGWDMVDRWGLLRRLLFFCQLFMDVPFPSRMVIVSLEKRSITITQRSFCAWTHELATRKTYTAW